MMESSTPRGLPSSTPAALRRRGPRAWGPRRLTKDNDVQLRGPVNANCQSQFNIGGARRACDECHCPAQAVPPFLAEYLQHLAQRVTNLVSLDDRDMDPWHERGQTMPLLIRLQHQRAGLGYSPLGAGDAGVAIEESRWNNILKQLCF
jgi:hypothetical protein